MKSKVYYVATGVRRGRCQHRHKTKTAAQRCADRDSRSCAGGSDRHPVGIEEERDTMKKSKRWSLEAGRGLLLNGKPVLYFSIHAGLQWSLLPWQADRLSHRIVAALNAADRHRREKRQKEGT